MIVKFECALCWISMQTTTNLTALWAYISYSSAIKWWPSAQWSIVLLNDSDSKMYFCYLKDGQPKNLYIHLSVHYILNIFGGLHCLQTAAWCGAGTAVLVCRNMNIVQLRKSSPKEKGCSTAALLQRVLRVFKVLVVSFSSVPFFVLCSSSPHQPNFPSTPILYLFI